MKYGFRELVYYNRGIKKSTLKPVTTVLFLFLLLLLPFTRQVPLVSNYISAPYFQTLFRNTTWPFLTEQLPHYQRAHTAKQSLLLDGLVEATPCEGVL